MYVILPIVFLIIGSVVLFWVIFNSCPGCGFKGEKINYHTRKVCPSCGTIIDFKNGRWKFPRESYWRKL